ncbi:MAG: fructose-1,6-bisphosphatase [Bacteroidaceae bacterium]|nr:fructose-1,6-bisphosphatase [Bacteroidaceae bacterium]MBR5148121.1 fructose-1,6-bisphosphatase [Bacteroidaceae bacterium]
MNSQMYTKEDIQKELNYLQLLSRTFRNSAEASTEIINLEAILNLPKSTEHFLADIHGEHEAFQHVLKNASGDIKRKVREVLSDELSDKEMRTLCTLIYYPSEKLQLIKAEQGDMDMHDWYALTLRRLISVCQNMSSKYTRSKVRKALPKEFSYIIQELLHESTGMTNKNKYVKGIIEAIINTNQADNFIVAICQLIQRLAIDRLHIVGDLFDRGTGSHLVMDTLTQHPNFDVQFGNHDVLWIGAAAGNKACMANVLRLCMRYGNLSVLEDGYGINLLDLAIFAMEIYKDDPCEEFGPKLEDGVTCSEKTRRLIAQMHKAVSVLQFKLEAEIIHRRPEYEMTDRLLLDKIDYAKGICTIGGKRYTMRECHFPTIDPTDPYKLSVEESEVIERIAHSFTTSEKLQRHIHCLLDNGSMYLVYNGNLLFHASVPMNPDGTLKEVFLYDGFYKGRSLLDKVDTLIRAAHSTDSEPHLRDFAIDYLWYLWCGKDAPTFDKDRMATFERYFLKDKSIMKETKGSYYTLRNEDSTVDLLLSEFGVEGDHRHIINGHIPVKTLKGENPMKAGGRLIVIDGGFSKPYQSQTGIAGYTLVYHSRGMSLVEHQPFTSTEEAIRNGSDIKSTHHLVETSSERIYVRDTDKGRDIRRRIDSLRKLLFAYQNGMIRELR